MPNAADISIIIPMPVTIVNLVNLILMDSPLLSYPNLLRRLPGALRRRAAWAWSWLAGRADRQGVEAAVAWLAGAARGDGLPAARGDPTACPSTTAMALGTASSLGLDELARRWIPWLISLQQPDGSLGATAHNAAWNTAQFVRGLSMIEPCPPAYQPALAKACRFLRSLVEEYGPDWPAGDGPMPGVVDPLTERLVCLSALTGAARRGPSLAADAALAGAMDVDRLARALAGEDIELDQWAWRIESLMGLGREDLANEALGRAEARQRPDGRVSARPGAAWVSSAGLAHLAAAWYRRGRRDPADRAMRWLERRQDASGGFPVTWGRGGEGRDRQGSRTVIHYLNAAIARVETAFDADAWQFPDRIDPADGRAEAVCRWFASLAADATVADVGCGKGRFLRLLAERFPLARLTGIDLSPAMLAGLPPGVTAVRGSLLRIPAADGALDAALAVESLEHALRPERAVAELCRIVRPGGRLLVIDKRRARQPLSRHDSWERWFTPEELAAWLRRDCDEVRVESISHLEGRPGRNLFLAASGRKRGGGAG
jgi:malonyl-CoA O-methyltransferase